jgi:hypothetical protein
LFLWRIETPGTIELYVSSSDGQNEKLSGGVVAGGNVAGFKISPDGFPGGLWPTNSM